MTASDEPILSADAVPASRPPLVWQLLGGVSLLANAVAVYKLSRFQFNVVRYSATTIDAANTVLVELFGWALVLLPIMVARRSLMTVDGLSGFLAACAPLALSLPLVFALHSPAPQAPWVFAIAMVFGNAWAVARATRLRRNTGASRPSALGIWIALIVAGFVVACAFHIRTQINFFEHLMLGHADMGHYAEELKNCLAGRGLRSDSFPNSRLGWHFVPLFYLMVPLYATWRSPVMLMALNALVLHAPAFVFFAAGWRWTRNGMVAFALGMTWMLLPSVSRLVYCNTYGFQWLYVSLPLLSILLVWLVELVGQWQGRRRGGDGGTTAKRQSPQAGTAWQCHPASDSQCHTASDSQCHTASDSQCHPASDSQCHPASASPCHPASGSQCHPASDSRCHASVVFGLAVVVLLVQETTASVVLGIGLTAILLGRRRVGIALMLVAIAYVLCCTQWIIPHFAASGRYERTDLFGDAGASMGSLLALPFRDPQLVLDRLFRPQCGFFLAVLLVSMGGLPLAQWRWLAGVVPTAGLMMILSNADWLSIKFWHQATILPVLLVAAMVSVVRGRAAERMLPRAMMLLAAAAWSHWFWGFSAISKPYVVYAHDQALHQPDPRYGLIQRIRESTSTKSTVLATQRAAAHFTDYRRIYTGVRPHEADIVFLDRADTWDTTGLPQSELRWRSDLNYSVFAELGEVIVFARRSPALIDD